MYVICSIHVWNAIARRGAGKPPVHSFIHSFFALYFDPFPFIIETNQGHVCDAIDDKDYATGMDADDVKFNRIRVC